uniref:Nucleoporin Nup159/Nup146 N-terminal domain-containing protein n=1 Tax=Magallana gigas TaxID=29159 RepID=K1QHM0_MAGGI
MTGVKTIFFQEFANSDIFDSIKTPAHFPTVTESEEYKQDFRFQQLCRIRIFDPPDSPFQGVTQLIACSSKYGLTFLGTTNGFKVIKTSDVTDIDIRHAAERTTLIVADPPIRTSVQVEGTVSHLCLSCDELTLAVVVTCNGIIQIYIYDVKGFANQGQNVDPFQKIRVTCEVLDMAWNPTQPTLLVVCMSDGRAQLLEVAENFKIVASLPPVVSACSVCWSPKGKQLVIGTGNGTLMQFDHELKKKRDWDRPSVLPEDQQFEVKGVSWISTFMFLASYFPRGSPDDQPTVVLTSGSKDGAPAFINFLDPCYGNGEGIASTMHFNYIPQWEMVLCTSSTACETAIVGKHFDDKNTFERWTLDDAARAELPLTEDYADTFPLGAAIDFSSQFQVPVGEQRYPPCPMFMLLSTDGVLVTYYMMYSHAQAQAQPITSPPQDLPAGPVRRPTAANAQGSVQKDAAPIEARPTPQSGQPGVTSAVPLSQAAENKASAFGFSASGSTGNFKPQPAANFSLNASVTKPSISAVPTQPVGASTAGGFSLPGHSSGGSNSGFNFSLSSLNTTGQTASPSSAPVSSKAVTAPVTQSQITSGTSAASKQSVFSFSSSAAPSEGFGVKPLATSTTPAFGMTPTTTVTAATTKSIFGTPGSSSLSKFGSTPETAQPNAPSMSSAVKTATGGSSLLMRGFGSSSVPTFGTKPGAAAITPTFGDAKSATMTPGSIPPPQSKPAIAAALTSSFGGSMQNLSALGQGPNLNNTKQQSSPGVERQQSEGSRSKTPVADASQKTSSASESLNDTFSASIAEEIAHFEKELCEFRQRAGAVKESIGSKEDMQRLRNTTTKISNFCDEVKANTKELSKEISDLKSLCLDGFAMVEDCKMREQRNTDAQYVQLLRNRALDPKSLATMRSLQQQQQLLDQGLRDVDAILDQEWEDYQNKKKKRQGEPAELSSLVDSLLESPKKAPDDPRRAPSVQTLDPNKQAKLREYLSRKTVTKVKSTRPENLSMSRLASTEKIRQALSRQSSPTKAPSSAEMKSMVQGRPILRATSHNGSRQLVNQGLQPTSPGMEAVTRQQISMQPKPNTYQQGFNFANSGNTKPSLMAYQQKLPQNSERKPPPSSTAPVMGFSGAATTKPLSFSPQTFGQGMSGFTSFTAGGNKPVFGAKPDSTTPTGSPKPSFNTGFQGFKSDEKTPTNTSTPKTAFKFGSDVQPSFGGKNLFGQPLKTEDKKTEESKPISSPLLAKALTADSEDDDDLGLGKNDTATEQAKLDNKTSGKPSTEPKFDTASKTPSFGIGKVPSSIALSDLGKEGSGQPLGVTSGLFGQPSGTSVFGGAISSTTTSSAGKSVFGFGAPVGASSGGGFFGQSSTTSGGLFGKSTKDEDTDKASPKTTASTGLFGQNLASSSTGLFGQKSSQASVTSKSDVSGQDTSSKVASSTVASASENPPASELSTASAISSAAGMTSSTPGSSLFGQPQTTTATSGLFGQTSAAVSTAGSGLFGQKTTSSGTTYGQALAPPPPPTYSSTEAGLLGRPLTSGSGAFGQSSTTSAIATSLFGQQTTTTGSGSLSKQTTTTGSGLFGQPATSSGAGLFGQPTTTASGLFGQANAASSTSGTGLFGQSSTTSTSGGGLFGTSASSSVSTAGTSVFGQVSSSSTSASTGLFGQTGSGGFGQSSTGTKPSVLGGLLTGTDEAPATSTAFGQGGPSKNLFGTETSSAAPSFGQPAPLFGSSTASTGPGFGGTTTSAGFGSAGSGFGFGGSATTTSATGFGQTNQTGLFGQPTSSSSSAFGGFGSASSGQTSGGMFGGGGGMFSGLGGKPSEDKAKTNVFGSVPTFGSTAATQANLFGNQSPSTFSSAGGSSPFSGSGFSGGGSNVASTGFGVAKSQSPSGFGAPPSFGGTPGFGSQAAFGSSPSFGSAPAFGGGSTFGGGSSFQNQLGSPQNTGGGGGGFAGFASSASPTFGSLAQGGSTPPTFGSVPQGGGGFGGFGATGGGGGGFGGASPGFGQAPSSG